jgi:hypothetical protein
MGILDIFTGGAESDDVNVLPPSLIPIYLNPHRALGLDESSTNVSLLRETFRKLCLGKLTAVAVDMSFFLPRLKLKSDNYYFKPLCPIK